MTARASGHPDVLRDGNSGACIRLKPRKFQFSGGPELSRGSNQLPAAGRRRMKFPWQFTESCRSESQLRVRCADIRRASRNAKKKGPPSLFRDAAFGSLVQIWSHGGNATPAKQMTAPKGGRFVVVFQKNTGAAEGTRTPDPIITNDVLYQLSYSGTFCSLWPSRLRMLRRIYTQAPGLASGLCSPLRTFLRVFGLLLKRRRAGPVLRG